jgi:hypothetical protein
MGAFRSEELLSCAGSVGMRQSGGGVMSNKASVSYPGLWRSVLALALIALSAVGYFEPYTALLGDETKQSGDEADESSDAKEVPRNPVGLQGIGNDLDMVRQKASKFSFGGSHREVPASACCAHDGAGLQNLSADLVEQIGVPVREKCSTGGAGYRQQNEEFHHGLKLVPAIDEWVCAPAATRAEAA